MIRAPGGPRRGRLFTAGAHRTMPFPPQMPQYPFAPSPVANSHSTMHATTVLLVRRGGKVVMASDGQVTVGDTVMKASASKVKRVGRGDVLVGFAGGAADGLALYTRFEGKLEEYQSKRIRRELTG